MIIVSDSNQIKDWEGPLVLLILTKCICPNCILLLEASLQRLGNNMGVSEVECYFPLQLPCQDDSL